MKCPRRACYGPMAPGIALVNSWVIHADFPGDRTRCFTTTPPVEFVGRTMSRIGPPVLQRVLKCRRCGHSVGA